MILLIFAVFGVVVSCESTPNIDDQNRLINSISSSHINDRPTVHEYILVRGNVDFNNTAEFLPFGIILSSELLSDPPQGEYVLNLYDTNNNFIKGISFQPNRYQSDYPEEDFEVGSFNIPVFSNPPIKRIDVVYNGKKLNSIIASQSSPDVKIVYPNGGESLTDAIVVLRWISNDTDGDSLIYTVQYSSSGGETWETLTVDWSDTKFEINLNILKGTSKGLIRVIASDGFNVSYDESDGFFSTPNNPPEISISSPQSDSVFTGGQLIFFEAIVLDREDGILSGENLQWVSNNDGLIGYGERFEKAAIEFSEGNHVITLAATDKDGNTTFQSVAINVMRIQ